MNIWLSYLPSVFPMGLPLVKKEDGMEAYCYLSSPTPNPDWHSTDSSFYHVMKNNIIRLCLPISSWLSRSCVIHPISCRPPLPNCVHFSSLPFLPLFYSAVLPIFQGQSSAPSSWKCPCLLLPCDLTLSTIYNPWSNTELGVSYIILFLTFVCVTVFFL